jgi:hypothetical protein
MSEIVALEKKTPSEAVVVADEARLKRATAELERVIASSIGVRLHESIRSPDRERCSEALRAAESADANFVHVRGWRNRWLAGTNGAGKSTLLNILATVLTASRGTVVYGDRTVADGGAALRGGSGCWARSLPLPGTDRARESDILRPPVWPRGRFGAVVTALERAGLSERATIWCPASLEVCGNASPSSARYYTIPRSFCSTSPSRDWINLHGGPG